MKTFDGSTIVDPLEGLRIARKQLSGLITVWCGSDLIDFYRDSSAILPGQFVFHVDQVPFRFNHDGEIVAPWDMDNDTLSEEWMSSPIEVVKAISHIQHRALPLLVLRPLQTLSAI